MAKRNHGKKANKIKDPYAIRRERERGQIFNKKPADPDDEFVPKKVQSMMSLVDRIANGEKVTSRPRKRKHLSNGRVSSRDFVRPEAAERGMTRPLKPIPLFEQGPGESDGRFLRRVEKLTKERIHQSRFEDKYNVDIMPDPETGQTKMISRESDNEKKRNKKRRVGEDGEEIPKKINRKKAMKLKRKEKLAEKKDAFAHLSDRVQFGDVVQRPPELKVAPKKAPVDDERSRPGRKSLLLKRLFTDAQAGARSSTAPKSLHQRAALEEERQRVVAAYRQLRQQKIERAAAAAGRL
ncbi:coiled-coil domain-containing protein 137-like isoform X1 [Amphibalanus amphitrite]|uniref:coiled-coil domain-containing protein 137-like isoform X1 n=2 Tax=Amphibalanus amphitrite TaxID=1232801 RepID=UPI001C92B708|nr:coiled-coil domain-containing protein 137-like isoform X1 [Amphibalanus amphitrite]XP_043196223.1 coiled-coil domain-containing protein 137-like isoform X1 [Amphibalanus amphitrite]XP_043196225.1 coiled-coil domain-containing protein 137-like isoform X1 [Amphibalanus amphitrite]